MKIQQHGSVSPSRTAGGRQGTSYTLIPETPVDQAFIEQLETTLMQEQFRNVTKTPILHLGIVTSAQGEDRVYNEFRMGIYEPPRKKPFWRRN